MSEEILNSNAKKNNIKRKVYVKPALIKLDMNQTLGTGGKTAAGVEVDPITSVS